MNIHRQGTPRIVLAAGILVCVLHFASLCRGDDGLMDAARRGSAFGAVSGDATAAFPYGHNGTTQASLPSQPTSPQLLSDQERSFPTTFSTDQRWTIELLGTGLGDVTNRHVGMGGLTTGVGYYVFTNVAIEMELTGYGFNEGHSSGAAVGITLGIRHHIFHIRDNSFFLDVAGGEIEASNNLPPRGTHLNNTIQFGMGVAHPIAENCYLVGGVRYYHISNARSEGDDRNPSINAIQGLVGVMWRF